MVLCGGGVRRKSCQIRKTSAGGNGVCCRGVVFVVLVVSPKIETLEKKVNGVLRGGVWTMGFLSNDDDVGVLGKRGTRPEKPARRVPPRRLACFPLARSRASTWQKQRRASGEWGGRQGRSRGARAPPRVKTASKKKKRISRGVVFLMVLTCDQPSR